MFTSLSLLLASVIVFSACSLQKATPRSSPTPAAGVHRIAFDVHSHLFRLAQPSDRATPQDLLRQMDSAGIERAAIISAGYRERELTAARLENDFVAQQARQNWRFLSYCGVHPLETWAHDELVRCARDLKMIGVKLHVNEQRIDLLREEHLDSVERILMDAGSLGLIVLIHVDKNWNKLIPLFERHPSTNVILAHCLFHEYRDLAYLGSKIENMRKTSERVALPKLFVDTSGLLTYYATAPNRHEIAWHLRKLGIERVLFGSDFPLSTQPEAVEALHAYGFTDNELSAIESGNAVRLFRR
jgi:uncharacterized protein